MRNRSLFVSTLALCYALVCISLLKGGSSLTGDNHEREKHVTKVGKYSAYFASPLEPLVGPYSEKGTVTEEELGNKLLFLLENPDCWFNQRGKKVLLLFNETNFPEEYAIIRRSKGIFSGKGKLEEDFKILEEEEEREKLMQDEQNEIFEEAVTGGIFRGMVSLSVPDRLESSEVPKVNDTISEEMAKQSYKLKIKKLLGMRRETLCKIRKVNFELSELNSSFIQECDDQECDACIDYQSSINSKYVERNKLRNRYRRIANLLKEFVDHSNRFVLENDLKRLFGDELLEGDDSYLVFSETQILGEILKDKMKKISKLKIRHGYNITRDDAVSDASLSPEENYLRMKRLLKEEEERITREENEIEEDKYCSDCRERLEKCTEKELKYLLERREKLRRVVMGVRFFLESLSERDCLRCNKMTFNGFTDFSEMIDTQIRTLEYYNKVEEKIEQRIDECVESIDNKEVVLSTEFDLDKEYRNEFFDLDHHEHLRDLWKVYNKYKIYNKSFSELMEKMAIANFYQKRGVDRMATMRRRWDRVNECTERSERSEKAEEERCNSDILVLMSEYRRELVGKKTTNEIEMRSLGKRVCKLCSSGFCDKCRYFSKLSEGFDEEILTYEEHISIITDYLQYCNYDEMSIFRNRVLRSSGRDTRDFWLDKYFGEDGVLWSLERYSSDSFIKRVVNLRKGVKEEYKLKILKRIQLTLRTLIKVLRFSFLKENSGLIGRAARCRDRCKNESCNECLKRLRRESLTLLNEDKYMGLLRMVEREIRILSSSSFSRKRERKRRNSKQLDERFNLRHWKPREIELLLRCDRANYLQSYMYFRELEEEIEKNKNIMVHLMNRMLWEKEDAVPITESQLIDLLREWNRIWNDTKTKKESFKLVNNYLSKCIRSNIGFERFQRSIEIERLNNFFKEQSKRIDKILTKLREESGDSYIDFNEMKYPDFEKRFFNVNLLMQTLDNEFRLFGETRRRLNSSIYKEGFDSLGDNMLENDFCRPGERTSLNRTFGVIPEQIIIQELEEQGHPIPGIRKYLELLSCSDGHFKRNHCRGKSIEFLMKSNPIYSCSKTEILVLYNVVSLLAQNEVKLGLFRDVIQITCGNEKCQECNIKNDLSKIITSERSLIEVVLEKSTSQLSQCLLDTSDDFVSKKDYIEFQNSLRMYLFEQNSFNSMMKSRFEFIKNSECDLKSMKRLLDIKSNVSSRLYPWITKVLDELKTLENLQEDSNENLIKYKSIVYQFIQLLDYSEDVHNKIKKCLGSLNILLDHEELII